MSPRVLEKKALGAKTAGAPGPPTGTRIPIYYPDPTGDPGPPAVLVLSAFFSRTRGDTGPVPTGRRVRGCSSSEMEPDPGIRQLSSLACSYGELHESCHSKRGYPSPEVPTC